jgi:hypothetical protein
VRGDARYLVQPGSQRTGSLAAVRLSPRPALHSCHSCYTIAPGEVSWTRVGDEHEQSLPAWTDMVGQELRTRQDDSMEFEDPEQGGGQA